MEKLSHKEYILQELYFEGKFNTRILKDLFDKGVSISGTSLKNRLYELEREGKVRRYMVDGHRELFNEIIREDNIGQRTMI